MELQGYEVWDLHFIFFLLLVLWIFCSKTPNATKFHAIYHKKTRQMPHCSINLPKIWESTLEKNVKIKWLHLNEGPKRRGVTITKLFAKFIINMHDESIMISNKLLAERDSNELLNKIPHFLMIFTSCNTSY